MWRSNFRFLKRHIERVFRPSRLPVRVRKLQDLAPECPSNFPIPSHQNFEPFSVTKYPSRRFTTHAGYLPHLSAGTSTTAIPEALAAGDEYASLSQTFGVFPDTLYTPGWVPPCQQPERLSMRRIAPPSSSPVEYSLRQVSNGWEMTDSLRQPRLPSTARCACRGPAFFLHMARPGLMGTGCLIPYLRYGFGETNCARGPELFNAV